MTRLVEMRERMGVFRVLAASDMATGETDAQLIPSRPDGEAILAAVRARFHIPYLAKVFAVLRHISPNLDLAK